MINESQAEFLLTECEEWLGTKLDGLRQRIRNDHDSTKPHLWELVVLHAAASSTVAGYVKQGELTSQMSDFILHEPEEANPDIFLHPNNCAPFFIEVAYVMLQDKGQKFEIPEHAKDNPIYKAIKKKSKAS